MIQDSEPRKARRYLREHAELSFPVTCVIGHVILSDVGEDSPYTAAFKLIGQHGVDGAFSFPTPDGHTVHVVVDTEHSKEAN